MSSFCSSRLVLARKHSGLTKKELASLLDLSVRSITSYESENDDKQPSKKTVEKISTELGFPISFFYDEADIKEIPVEIVNFRARTKMTHRQRDKAMSSAQLALIYSDWLDKHFELPCVDLPTIDDIDTIDPSMAAERLRQIWNLGQAPIRNMVILLESHGVKVFSLYEEEKEIDAFSYWDEDRKVPFVFLSTAKSGERGRMDAAHELGHLVMHRFVDLSSKRDLEQEANDFAGAFLIPERDVKANTPRSCTLDAIINAKGRWQVSVAALIYRMNRLDLLSRWQYQSLYKQMSAKGMRTKEPHGIERERSQILDKVFSISSQDGLRIVDIAMQMNLPYEEIAKLSFKPPLKSISGRRTNRPDCPSNVSQNIYLIK